MTDTFIDPDLDAVTDGDPSDDPILDQAREMFALCEDADSENRTVELEDRQFVKLPMEHQWPADVRRARMDAGRPCLTLDKLNPFIRQVVNDARQNKPQIKTKPVDSNGDIETADILDGLIRNIQYASDADVAYDTAMDDAVSGGRGYFRINTRYSGDDTFDQDIIIERIANSRSVWGDPYSTAADSSDWNVCFVTDMLSRKAYEHRFRGADVVSWDNLSRVGAPWFSGDEVMVAEYWKREEVEEGALMLDTGEVVRRSVYEENDGFPDAMGQPAQIMASRPIKTHKVTQYLLSGAQVLETVEWPGIYIPIVPVYGDEFTVDGKRHFRSLIHNAKDAMRLFNYQRSAFTEATALAPLAPFIGPEQAFQGEDAAKWPEANTTPHAFLSYKGNVAPQRMQPGNTNASVLQDALNASDDIKSVIGVYDASLGARSNETSGRAILARQREGDVSTFHFIDNLSRALKHAGRIIIDLIPHIYTANRIVRVLGEDGKAQNAKLIDPNTPEGQQALQEQQLAMQAQMDDIQRVYDLSAGKYDVVVETGPSFTTQREEANAALTAIIQAAPQFADVLAPIVLKTFDFPGADKVLEQIEARQAQQSQGGPSPEMQAKQAEMQIKAQEAMAANQIETQRIELDAYKAETDRIKVLHDIQQPRGAPRIPQ